MDLGLRLKTKEELSYGLNKLLNKIVADRIAQGVNPEDAVDPVKLDAVLDSEKKLRRSLKKMY